MKILNSIVILTMTFCMVLSENPGVVLDIKMQVIEKIRDNYFTQLFKDFGHQTLPDIKSGDLEIKDITADISNTSPDNLKIQFVEGSNVLAIEVDSTNIDVSVNFHYSESIVSVSGSAKLKGPIDKLTMNLGFDKKSESTYFIPQIKVDQFKTYLDKGAFSFDFSCHNCPGFVEDLVEKYLKDDLVDEVAKALNEQLPSELNSDGNKLIDESYPRSVTLYNNIDIETSMSDGISVKSDHLEIPLDSTIFLHEKGYHRAEDAPVIPTYNPNDPGEIMLFLSPYLLLTLGDTLNEGVQTYNTTFMGTNYQVFLDPAVGKTALTFEEGDFAIDFSPKIMATDYSIGIEITASAKLNPVVSKGDSKNMFYVTPKIKSLQLSTIKLLSGTTPVDISFIASYLNTIVESLINTVAVPVIPVPKQSVLPLHVTKSELDFHSNYSEFGIVFDFGTQ